jgi:cutinase
MGGLVRSAVALGSGFLMMSAATTGAAVASADVTSPAPLAALSQCAPVTFYGVKGSGENSASSPMGESITAVAKFLRNDLLGTVRMTTVPVSYPAVSVFDAIDDGLLNGVNYPTSRAHGVLALGGLLAGQIKKCPSTRLVLAGFSQGADVIGAYLDGKVPSGVRKQIAGVALLGDPRFNPHDAKVDAGSFNPKFGPLLGKFPVPPNKHREGSRRVLPVPFNAETMSVCNKGDPICNYSWSNALGCVGVDAWKSFYASIIAGKVVPVPELRKSCAHFHYRDSGSAEVSPGSKVTATAIAYFLSQHVRRALGDWIAANVRLPANAENAPATSSAAYPPLFSSMACPAATSCVATGLYFQKGDSGLQDPMLVTGSGTSWKAIEAPLPANGKNDVIGGLSLSGVACPSVTKCTAIGTYFPAGAGDAEVMVLTGSGSSWKAAEVPNPANVYLSNISALACPSPSACVAVGSGNGFDGVLLTKSGSSWKLTTAPLPANAPTSDPLISLPSVACLSATNCTAVGSYYDNTSTQHAVLLHWNGSTWTATQVHVPADSSEALLSSVSCSKAAGCAAVGYYIEGSFSQNNATVHGLLLTGSGASWRAVSVPVPAHASSDPGPALTSVACTQQPKCAAFGTYTDSRGFWQGLLLTGSASSWIASQAPVPPGGLIEPDEIDNTQLVACTAASGCAATSGYQDTSNKLRGLLLRGIGSSWEASQLPLPPDATGAEPTLGALACAPTSSCVAAGYYSTKAAAEPGVIFVGPS